MLLCLFWKGEGEYLKAVGPWLMEEAPADADVAEMLDAAGLPMACCAWSPAAVARSLEPPCIMRWVLESISGT